MNDKFTFTGSQLKDELAFDYTQFATADETFEDWLGRSLSAYLAIEDNKLYETDASLSYWEEEK